MQTPLNWKDYELLDSGDGMKLERWGSVLLARPDPQALWSKSLEAKEWNSADGIYHRSKEGGGHWKWNKELPDRWEISYKDLTFWTKPTSFKHTGLFPEQAVNWDWMREKITSAGRPISVLNLFAYTGAATVACAAAGASVVHVDAAKGMVNWGKENLDLSGLTEKPVRFIVDDVVEFVARESRRGHTYDAIIMDPPSYGRGSAGETWKIEAMLFPLVADCQKILSADPLFFIINSYTTGLSPTVSGNMLKKTFGNKGTVESFELGLKPKAGDITLPAGSSARWSR